jgi:hypothetical protein
MKGRTLDRGMNRVASLFGKQAERLVFAENGRSRFFYIYT